MIEKLKRLARRFTASPWTPPAILDELGDWERELLTQVKPFTLTSPERIYALMESVRYVVRRGIPGAFAECGVWRGGSVLAMILVLQHEGATDRDIYLYDTFEGMTKPSDLDISDFDRPALEQWHKTKRDGGHAWPQWFNQELFNLDLVKRVLQDTGYPTERLHFIQGTVEQTIPQHVPERLALLRLDTDWYESTRHELQHLYPRLQSGGVLLIDDYGHWKGCRQAVDEYFASGVTPLPLLQRVDYSCRMAVKA
jgi:O-methyltransferase